MSALIENKEWVEQSEQDQLQIDLTDLKNRIQQQEKKEYHEDKQNGRKFFEQMLEQLIKLEESVNTVAESKEYETHQDDLQKQLEALRKLYDSYHRHDGNIQEVYQEMAEKGREREASSVSHLAQQMGNEWGLRRLVERALK